MLEKNPVTCPKCGSPLETKQMGEPNWGTYIRCTNSPTCQYFIYRSKDFKTYKMKKQNGKQGNLFGKAVDGVKGLINYSAPITYIPKCRHWRQPVKVGEFTITCSSSMHTNHTLDPKPDFGMYLADSWMTRMNATIVSNGPAIKQTVPYPAIFVDWKDMSGAEVTLLDSLVAILEAQLKAGKNVDIGCMGGHGRTGTLLACLIAYLEKTDSNTTMQAVWSRYCKEAIETVAQENTIREFCGEKPIHVKPATPIPYYKYEEWDGTDPNLPVTDTTPSYKVDSKEVVGEYEFGKKDPTPEDIGKK